MSSATRIRVLATAVVFVATAGCLPSPSAKATDYHDLVGVVAPLLNPTSAPGLPNPEFVPGKEYSLDFDAMSTGAADPGRVIAWDGLGGTDDWLDYDDQVDALANFYDTLVGETRADTAHLIFSIAASSSVLPGAPVHLQNSEITIGGPDELSYERAGFFPLKTGQSRWGVWATPEVINESAPPADVDALELWGPEPATSFDERNKFSLENDYASYDTAIPGDAVSVWNYNGTPFIAHSTIVDVVEDVLEAPAGDISQIDVDALMVLAINGSPHSLDPDLGTGTHDVILFSIRQIASGQDYYATGSEIFWLDGSGNRGFLRHGQHDWSRQYALEYLRLLDGSVIDINALEAVTAVPEPTSVMLFLLGIVGLGLRCLRRGLSS